jgi:hypothetical protein
MVQVQAVRRRNLHGVAHCNGGNLPVLNGSSGYGNSGGASVSDGILARDPREPWLCAAVAGLTGRI